MDEEQKEILDGVVIDLTKVGSLERELFAGAFEDILDKFPGVIESCVCGIYDEKFGEIVGTYIYTNDQLEVANIKEFLSDNLAAYKIPEIFIFTNERLPRIASEKFDRVGIKEILTTNQNE